ncbi:YcaC like amidohydrolase [Legionella beliardensis]|uniref:YcaC like amidohydrolase n=1 Tax=Legionella beliardensis TaxID=91822 RepID=A0A378I288_9GAMM|nr:hydrolase [Legionella beliardensis]STX29307.1 YcaC like amidohydrolase [Legionella beliardensis]
MLIKKDDACLLLIDVQEKLLPLVADSEALIDRCQWLLRLANELEVPCLVSEQYPRGLGHTVKPLLEVSSQEPPIEKVHFSCYREPNFVQRVKQLGKTQFVLIGIEAHVCVLQTALDLLAEDNDVFIVVDAVSSRKLIDKKYALKRLQQAGAILVTAEMVFFEWLEQAGTPLFKALSNAYLK